MNTTWKGAARIYLLLLLVNAASPVFLWLILNWMGHSISFPWCLLIVLGLVAIATVTAIFIQSLPFWTEMTNNTWMNIDDYVPEEGKIVLVDYHGDLAVMMRNGQDWYEALEFKSPPFTIPQGALWTYPPRPPGKSDK